MNTHKALLALIALVSTQYVDARKDKKPCCDLPEGVLNAQFAKKAAVPGIAQISLSQFTDFATDAVIQKDKKNCFKRLLVKATGVHKKNHEDEGHKTQIDGFRNELASAIVAVNECGVLDKSFGPHNTGIVWDSFGEFSDYIYNIDITKDGDIITGGFTSVNREGAQDQQNHDKISNFNGGPVDSDTYACGWQPFYNTGDFLSYSVRQLAVGHYDCDGKLKGHVNFDAPHNPTKPKSWGNISGQSSQAGFISHDGERYYLVGAQSDTSKEPGCFAYNGLVAAIDITHDQYEIDHTWGTTHGFVVEDSTLFDSFNYWQAGLEQKDGKVVVVGYSTSSVDDRAQTFITLARYKKDGKIDTDFGGASGYVTIKSENLSLQAYSIVQDEDGFLYIGGNSFTGKRKGGRQFPLQIPFGRVPGVFYNPVEKRDFFVCKLDKEGKAVNGFGTAPIIHYNGTEKTNFCGVTTNFFGFSDAILALSINDECKTLTAAGQVSSGSNLEDMRAGFARYKTKDGSLDATFGAGGKITFDAQTSGQQFASALVKPDLYHLIYVGQATNGAPITIWGQENQTKTDVMVGSLN